MEYGIQYIDPSIFIPSADSNLAKSYLNIITTDNKASSIIIEDDCVEIEPHTVLIIGPQLNARVNFQEKSPYHYLFFSEGFYSQAQNDSILLPQLMGIVESEGGYLKVSIPPDYISFSQFANNQLKQAFENYSNSPLIKDLVHLIIRQIIIYVYLKLTENQINVVSPLTHVDNSLLWNFYELIDKHVHKEKHISFYAESLKTTPRRLASLTKKAVSKTPKELITEGHCCPIKI
ncbi:hypothetical protein EDC17_103336 [Sphingobacterium alimentarium]|uniref:AraC family transcriptional regulator n=1 Tax=Sphingobacterium alimentarium TaxID=797292 RepID=A0A4R3VW64_9SPHI|nr:hypothetical protein [Sphingobacterium alimentarium]TCV10463.1 hypothetical protein EDC17_103336 [Sphingobacterium alimentarium]